MKRSRSLRLNKQCGKFCLYGYWQVQGGPYVVQGKKNSRGSGVDCRRVVRVRGGWVVCVWGRGVGS